MENTLLVGLSRQMTLERQMDVVANNVANINTTGFKADRSLFEEFLTSRAHEDNFVGRDRRVSFVQDRATFHDFAQGPVEQTKNPLDVAIDGNGFLVVQTPAGERYTRDGGLQINNQGQLVTVERLSGARRLRPDRVPADRQGRSPSPPTATSRCSKAPTGSTRCAASCGWSRFADAQKLVKEGSNLYSAGARHRGAARHRLEGAPGLHREIERQFRRRDEPHDRGDAYLHADLGDAAAAGRPAQNRNRETRRRSGISEGTDPCALFTPQRPEWRHRNSTFR